MGFASSFLAGAKSAVGGFGSMFGVTRVISEDPTGSSMRALTPYFGPPPISGMAHDAIWSDTWVQPWRGPLDLDRDGRETEAMRMLFREAYRKEPAVRSAVRGKVNAIASLDLTVIAGNRRDEMSCKAAEFVKWAITRNQRGEHGLVQDILTGGFVDGWSLNEIKLRPVDEGESMIWEGFWTLDKARNIDTHHMRLQMDQYRNVTGIVNLIRGVQFYEREKCILYTHSGQYSNPFGQSDLRAVVRAVALIEDAYRIWFIAMKRFGLPYFHGKVKNAANRAQLEDALKELYAGGWAVTTADDSIEVLNLANAASFNAFEQKINKLREDIYLAVRSVYLPFLEGQGGTNSHGDTSVHKVASDAEEDVLAKDISLLYNLHLVPYLVRPNFGMTVELPICLLGGTNWGDIKQRLECTKILVAELGLPVSKQETYEAAKHAPPESVEGLDDTLANPNAAQGAAGGAAPAAAGPSGPQAMPGAPAPGAMEPPPINAGQPDPNAAPPDIFAEPAMFSAAARSGWEIAADEIIDGLIEEIERSAV